MARDRFGEDDYSDDYPHRRRPGTNPALIIGLVLGGLVLVLLVCGGLFALMWTRTDARMQEARAARLEAEAAENAAAQNAAAPKDKAAIRPAGGNEENAKKPAAPNEVIDIENAGVLLDDFHKNVIGAAQKWVGKRVRFTSEVMTISTTRDRFYVGFWGRLFGYPAKDQLEAFGKIQRGDKITVEGKIERYEHDPTAVSYATQIDVVDLKLVRVLPKK